MEVTSGDKARLFTTKEANALVPALQLSFAAIGRIREEIESMLSGLAGGNAVHLVEVLRGETSPSAEELPRFERLQELIAELGQSVDGLISMGVLVHELDPGQVDLPAIRDERVVMLCWQYGEPQVAWYHELEQDFEDRRPLPEAPLHLH